MARPASRYFVPVIRKISEMKKAENIRIDQQFKADLRGELLLRAGLGEAGAREEAFGTDETEGLSGINDRGGFDLYGFLNKWKYQMALVPVALVLMLVAVQSFKMPVKMESETMVPVAGESAETVALEQVTPEQTMEETQTRETGTWGDELLMTGAELKSGSAEITGQKGVSRTASPTQTVDEPARTGGQDMGTEQAPEGGQVNVYVPAVKVGPVVTTTPVAPVVPVFAPATREAVDAQKKPGVAAGDVPSELMDEVAETQPLMPRAVEEPTLTVAPVVIEPLTEVYAPRVMQTDSAEPVGEVYYDLSFNGDKETLEERVLADLMKDGGYDYAAVSQDDDGVVTLELNAPDGATNKKTYKWNIRTLAWDEVIYVQNYYFDDNLQYERLNLTVPLFVPSGDRFYDTQYNRYRY